MDSSNDLNTSNHVSHDAWGPDDGDVIAAALAKRGSLDAAAGNGADGAPSPAASVQTTTPVAAARRRHHRLSLLPPAVAIPPSASPAAEVAASAVAEYSSVGAPSLGSQPAEAPVGPTSGSPVRALHLPAAVASAAASGGWISIPAATSTAATVSGASTSSTAPFPSSVPIDGPLVARVHMLPPPLRRAGSSHSLLNPARVIISGDTAPVVDAASSADHSATLPLATAAQPPVSSSPPASAAAAPHGNTGTALLLRRPYTAAARLRAGVSCGGSASLTAVADPSATTATSYSAAEALEEEGGNRDGCGGSTGSAPAPPASPPTAQRRSPAGAWVPRPPPGPPPPPFALPFGKRGVGAAAALARDGRAPTAARRSQSLRLREGAIDADDGNGDGTAGCSREHQQHFGERQLLSRRSDGIGHLRRSHSSAVVRGEGGSPHHQPQQQRRVIDPSMALLRLVCAECAAAGSALGAGAGVSAALTAACGVGHADCARTLLAAAAAGGATAAAEPPSGAPQVPVSPSLHVSLSRSGSSSSLLAALAAAHAVSSPPTVDTGAALRAAAAGGHEALLRQLLERGAHPLVADAAGVTPLAAACAGGHLLAAAALLEVAAPEAVAAVDAAGRTPLHAAVQAGSEPLVRVLVGYRADVGAVDAGGRPPLLYATSPGVAVALLEGGADPCASDASGQSALHLACGHGHADVLYALLAYDAVRARRVLNGREAGEGYTPLHTAAAWGHLDCAALLLSAGADPRAVTRSGHTPEQLAAGYGYAPCAAVLAAAAAAAATARVVADDGDATAPLSPLNASRPPAAGDDVDDCSSVGGGDAGDSVARSPRCGGYDADQSEPDVPRAFHHLARGSGSGGSTVALSCAASSAASSASRATTAASAGSLSQHEGGADDGGSHSVSGAGEALAAAAFGSGDGSHEYRIDYLAAARAYRAQQPYRDAARGQGTSRCCLCRGGTPAEEAALLLQPQGRRRAGPPPGTVTHAFLPCEHAAVCDRCIRVHGIGPVVATRSTSAVVSGAAAVGGGPTVPPLTRYGAGVDVTAAATAPGAQQRMRGSTAVAAESTLPPLVGACPLCDAAILAVVPAGRLDDPDAAAAVEEGRADMTGSGAPPPDARFRILFARAARQLRGWSSRRRASARWAGPPTRSLLGAAEWDRG